MAGRPRWSSWSPTTGAASGADVTAGVGLLSLRERAEELGGRCEVACPPTGGTTVRAVLPYGGAVADNAREEDR